MDEKDTKSVSTQSTQSTRPKSKKSKSALPKFNFDEYAMLKKLSKVRIAGFSAWNKASIDKNKSIKDWDTLMQQYLEHPINK